ncbi:hypothetical protein BKA70DRAFT_1031637, partial [Coprinopsis sp. MPI-PUGE-AT-0042]
LVIAETSGLGWRIDLALILLILTFLFSHREINSEKLEEAGDWDHRNRLKVYTSLHLLFTCQFKRAAGVSLDTLLTFQAAELTRFNECVAMGTLSGTSMMGRGKVKKVHQVLPDLPVLGEFFKNPYGGHYDKFFAAVTHLLSFPPSTILCLRNRRKMRIIACTQLLESYRSRIVESLT